MIELKKPLLKTEIKELVRIINRGFSPELLFVNGEEGVWYDPSDLTTLYQDSAATIPVTTDGDPVGLMLDKSKGLALGDDVFTGAYNLNNAPSATTEGDYINWSGSDGSEYIGIPVSPAVADDLLYEFEIEVTRYVQGDISGRLKTGTITPVGIDGVGTFRVYVKAGPGSFNAVYDDGIVDMTFRIVSIREVQGAHLHQSTGLSKPTYRTDGVRHWLETDIVDDFMVSALSKQWSPPFTLAVGARLFDGGNTGTTHFFGMGDANVNYMAIRVRQDSYSGNNRVSMDWRNFSGTGQSTTGNNQSQVVGLYEKPVAIFGAVNTDSVIEIKDTEGNASTTDTGATFGLSNNQPIRLSQGSAPRRFFGGVIIESEVDTVTRDRLLVYYAGKAGA